MQYDIKLQPDDNGTFLVTFPDFEDAITFGDDEADATFRATGALNEVIAARIAARADIPKPNASTRRGHVKVPLNPLAEGKLLLYWEMQAQGLKKADLARRLAADQKHTDRLLDINHNTPLPQLQRAFAALGKRVTLQLRDAV